MRWSESAYVRMARRPMALAAPPSFHRVMGAERSPLAKEWMRRREVSEEDVARMSFALFAATLALSAVAAAVYACFAGPRSAWQAVIPAALAPLIATALVMRAPESFARDEERSILRESPAAIGCLSMSMQLRPSLESAVSFTAQREEGVIASRLKEAAWSSLTRASVSVSDSVMRMTSALSEINDPFRQSMHLVMSAARERTKEGMDRLLDKASAISLAGVRDAVDKYAASLSVPTMTLFSLGTLLPIMMFSVLPLMTLGSALDGSGSPGIPASSLAFLLLVLFPACTLAYSHHVLRSNPVGASPPLDVDLRGMAAPVAAWACVIVAAALLGRGDPYVLSGSVVLPPCAYLAWRTRGSRGEGKRKDALAKEYTACLFQIGNVMASGETLERAMELTASARPTGGFASAARSILHRCSMGAGGLEAAMRADGSLRQASPSVENAYVTVARCAERDPVFAGQVAIHLAQMLSDLRACRSKIDERLRGVVDMMRSTGLLFAPVVLGVTGALFGMIGGGSTASSDIILMTGLYVAELSFATCYFTAFLLEDGGWKEVALQFGTRTPIAFAVFAATSLMCGTGLSSLL